MMSDEALGASDVLSELQQQRRNDGCPTTCKVTRKRIPSVMSLNQPSLPSNNTQPAILNWTIDFCWVGILQVPEFPPPDFA